jgi:hypothetical protein
MDPVTLSLILSLVAATVKLAPEVVSLIQRAQAGEKISPEEIAATRAMVQTSVENWKSSGKPAKES